MLNVINHVRQLTDCIKAQSRTHTKWVILETFLPASLQASNKSVRQMLHQLQQQWYWDQQQSSHRVSSWHSTRCPLSERELNSPAECSPAQNSKLTASQQEHAHSLIPPIAVCTICIPYVYAMPSNFRFFLIISSKCTPFWVILAAYCPNKCIATQHKISPPHLTQYNSSCTSIMSDYFIPTTVTFSKDRQDKTN